MEIKCSIKGCYHRGGRVINPKNPQGRYINLCFHHQVELFTEYLRKYYGMRWGKLVIHVYDVVIHVNYFKDFCFLVLLGNNFAISSTKHWRECLIESIKTKPAIPNIACCNDLVYVEHYAANLKCFSRFCTKIGC